MISQDKRSNRNTPLAGISGTALGRRYHAGIAPGLIIEGMFLDGPFSGFFESA